MKTLELSWNGISLEFGVPGLSPFVGSNYPRERLEGPEFDRTLSGALTQEDTSYEPPFLWNLEVQLRSTQFQAFTRLYDLWINTRPRTLLRLYDRVLPVHEPAPRTRAAVPGAIVTNDGGRLSYFAQFDVVFFNKPTYAFEGGIFARVNVQLLEGPKVAP